MRYVELARVVVLALSLGMFIPQAGANSANQEALALKKQEAFALNSGNYVGANSNKSVPVTGT